MRDPEVVRESPALAFEALAVHHEAAREVGAGCVRDAADAVAAARDARRGRGRRALAAVAVEDEDRHLAAREMRGGRRGAVHPGRRPFWCDDFGRGAFALADGPPGRRLRDERATDDDEHEQLDRRNRGRDERRRAPWLDEPVVVLEGDVHATTFARRRPAPSSRRRYCERSTPTSPPRRSASGVSGRKPIVAAASSPSRTLRPSSPGRSASWTGAASDPATERQTS